MAKRQIFIPKKSSIGFCANEIEFQWYPGFSKAQKQKSIFSLHQAAKEKGCVKVLEISTKSPQSIGVELSAFNLRSNFFGKYVSVESAFQGSKVFKSYGQLDGNYALDSRKAKTTAAKLHNEDKLISFLFNGACVPSEPKTLFYDWLYINALFSARPNIKDFDAFSDIEFNSTKSINCQARSAAIYVSLICNGIAAENVLEIEELKRLVYFR